MADLQHILSDNSTEKFYIEYGGFLTNHICHGIIALSRLGADRDQIQKFVDWYRHKLEPAEKYEKPKADVSADVSMLLGQHCNYYVLRDHYESQLAKHNGSCEKLIAEFLPMLVQGIVGSALHGIIHLGYGYAARNPRMVCEGLAYMHYSFIAPSLVKDSGESPKPDSLSVVEVAEELRKNSAMHLFIAAEMRKDEWKTRCTSDFQRSVEIQFLHYGDYIHGLAMAVQLPSVESTDSHRDAARQLGAWAVNTALTIYAVTSRKNDFFLLHGVTSAWALMQVLPLINDHATVVSAMRSYLCALCATYVAQGTLELQMERINSNAEASVEQVVRNAIGGSMERDEHIFKLIQVCSDMSSETDDAKMRNIYAWAANIAQDNPLTFD